MPDRTRFFAEYETPERLLEAVRFLRGLGHDALDAYTPYPLPMLDEALGLGRSRLPASIFVGGSAAAAFAYALQWLLVAYLYPLDVGGRPPHMPLPFVIIAFEMGVLFAALTGFVGLLRRARLLRLWDPVFEVEGFEGASSHRYWLSVRVRDGADLDLTVAHVAATGALRTQRLILDPMGGVR